MSILDTLTQSLKEAALTKLSQHELEEVIEALEVLEADKRYNKFRDYFPEEGQFRRELYAKHTEFFAAGAKYKERCFLAANRCLTKGTLVMTPLGPVPIEDIKIGDMVYDRYGIPVPVINKFDNGVKEVVSMQNRGKEYIRCTPNHKLDCIEINSHSYKWDLKTNKEVVVEAGKLGRLNLVRRTYVKSELGSVSFPYAYSVGAFLGDGCCTCGSRNTQIISSSDVRVVERIANELNTTYKKLKSNNHSFSVNTPVFKYYEDWCHNRLTHEKWVDLSVVKTWNRKTLLNFVAGLFDTGGSLNSSKDGYSLRFTNQSKSVIDAFAYAVLALWNTGVSISKDNRDKYKNGPVYNATVRNPHVVKYICSELVDYVEHKYKATPNSSISTGSRSRLEAIKLTPVYTGSYEQTYDITVASADHMFLLANGLSVSNSGKTISALYEMTCHLTGLYPEWWVGRRYNRPVELLAAGDTSQTTRDIIQFGLCGPTHDFGTGMLPKDLIVDTRPKRNIPDAYELIHVRHVSGGTSTIQLKSYDQGRQIFQGQVFDGVFLDEEVSQDVYSEALIRTMTSGGFTVLTFTPLSGLTDLVLSFIESDQFSDSQYPKFVTNCTWWDVPHLKPEEIDQMLAATPPQLREARSKGIPTAGSGRIYPIDINNVTVADFQIPKFWQKAYALDVGWQATAAIFGAWDKENDVVYLYSEHKQGEAEPVIHAKAIKSRGEWLKGVIDPASRGRSQIDGQNLFQMYKKEGLNIYPADNAVEAGIYEVWQRLSTGRLKIFSSCTSLIREYNLYSRDEKGKIIKKNDHLLDCVRYLVKSLGTGVWQYPQSPQSKTNVVDFNQYLKACI